MGKSCVRVRHEGVTKGALVEHILDHYAKRGGADFILCLGDDRMDERMFTILRDYHQAAQYRVVQQAQQEVRPHPHPRARARVRARTRTHARTHARTHRQTDPHTPPPCLTVCPQQGRPARSVAVWRAGPVP
jgi:trehalose-phosphatase